MDYTNLYVACMGHWEAIDKIIMCEDLYTYYIIIFVLLLLLWLRWPNVKENLESGD